MAFNPKTTKQFFEACAIIHALIAIIFGGYLVLRAFGDLFITSPYPYAPSFERVFVVWFIVHCIGIVLCGGLALLVHKSKPDEKDPLGIRE